MSRPTKADIEKWYPRIFRTALRMTGDADIADELTQQAFCKALSHWDQFNGDALPTTWLHRILSNCVRDWARQRKARAMEQFDEWALPAVHGADTEVEKLVVQEQLASIRERIRGLSPTLRPAFIATVLDGYTYEETSELLCLPVGTVAWRVHEARKQVTDQMRQLFPET